MIRICEKGDRNDCSNYQETLVRLSASYKDFLNILPSKLRPNMYEITGDDQCDFRNDRSTINHIFGFNRIWRKNVSTIRQYISYS
jgi:hypothetical protein